MTSRKKPELTPEDVQDPETVSGMKCQLDLDRQKWAEKMALRQLAEYKPSLEKQATSTRKKPESKSEDAQDPETIHSMKCQLDRDRQKDAEKKALRRLAEHQPTDIV
jgi:hypothetical protein